MILGPIPSDALDAVVEHELEPVIFDRETLDRIGKLCERHNRFIPTHLKLETGTNRQGITGNELGAFSKIYLKASTRLSHLSLSCPIPDTPHQKDGHYQEKGYEFLMPLAS